MEITNELKHRIVAALAEVRQNFTGSDKVFATQWGLNNAVYSQLKNGKSPDRLVSDVQWLTMGRKLGVTPKERTWKIVRTEVLDNIEEDVRFCAEYAKAMIFVDEPEIGKTVSGKYLSKTLKNCFYHDCSQSKSKQLFIRSLARTIGLDSTGKYSDVKENIKYYLQTLTNPVVIIDEAGDLEYTAFLELKELWNGTEGGCGWYMMGADGLEAKFKRGIANKKVGYRETFSRYSSKFRSIVPTESSDRLNFYTRLVTDVLNANCADKNRIPAIVKKAIISDKEVGTYALRRAESLVVLSKQTA